MNETERVKNLREKLANLEHEQWCSWSQDIAKNEAISELRLERWKKQWVAYSDLEEHVKDHDRVWADKVIAIVKEEVGAK